MKRQMFFASVFSAALAVGAAAQTGTAQTPTQDRTQDQQVTVTGCLAQAPSSATGTTGTTGAAAGSEYVLKNATVGSGSSASTTGTSGASSPASATKSYKLVGGSMSDFKDHVNAKVEIRGTIEKPSMTTAAPPASGTAPDKDVQTLRVTSIKKIADSCQ
jgi:hypothetical protein